MVLGLSTIGIGDPTWRQAHQPLYELGCGPWPNTIVQEGRGGSFSTCDVLPSSYSFGVLSPAVKMPSIRFHSVSDSALHFGEPCGPFKARSITWCESAIVPRRART